MEINNQVGLVLEGGGMRIAYSIGVMDYLLEQDINFNYVVGVSAGAGAAVNYISKQIGRARAMNIDYSQDKEAVGLKYWFLKGNFFNFEFLYDKLEAGPLPFDEETFKNSPANFLAGCYNMKTYQLEYFKKEDMIGNRNVLKATSSLPILAKRVKIKNSLYLDGGIVAPIPLEKSIEDGNKKHIVILTNPEGYVREIDSNLKLLKIVYWRHPQLIKAVEVRHLNYNAMIKRLETMEANGEAMLIRPKVDLGVTRYSRDPQTLTKAYEQGKADMAAKLNEMMEFIK